MYLGAHLNIPYVFGLFFSLSYKKLGHAAVVKASRDVSSLTKAKMKVSGRQAHRLWMGSKGQKADGQAICSGSNW